MAGARMGGALRQIHHLFVEGTVAGLPDDRLLERFLARGDGAAFAALVERHGPMVAAHVPVGPAPSRGRRGRLPGDVPGAGLQGPIDPGPGGPRGLAASGRASGRRPGRGGGGPAAGLRARRRRLSRRRPSSRRAGRRLAAGAARGAGPALGPVSPPGAPLRPGGQDARPGRGRAGLRPGDRAAAAHRRPRACSARG